jgi:ATP-dependent helicase/nuclease subunit B
MTPIALSAVDGAFWPRLADEIAAWLSDQGAAPRDAVVLLPHVGLLAPARAAFARRGGWQPRIETVPTLAASLAAPAPQRAGAPFGDRIADRLTAASLLAGVTAGSDPRSARALVNTFVDETHRLLRACARQAPTARAAWWDGLRAALSPTAGPGAAERRLARTAVEWAALADTPDSDAVRSVSASAWIVVDACGIDSSVYLPDDAAPRSRIELDPDAARPFDAAVALPAPRSLVAASLEDEAAGTALAIVEALDAGATSVALIAQDRLVVRRIRALLERVGVGVDDETGWTLSTTRAAARCMAWLRGTLPEAGRDARIEALRAEAAPPSAVSALEAAWREARAPAEFAQALDDDFSRRADAWRASGEQTLAQWLRRLHTAAPGLMAALAADAAGRQVIDVLGLAQSEAPWSAAAQSLRMELAPFIAWADDTPSGARVTALPLARAALRPFDAVVLPGCDARHLGPRDAAPGWLPDAVAREFGIADAAQHRLQEQMAFAHLLRAPHLVLLRRTHDAAEELAPSPLLERALLARRRLGRPTPAREDVALPMQRVAAAPIERPAPQLADLLPQSLSASAVQALRDCPYRFFALRALGLRAGEELDDDVDNRDYGNWVHGLLRRFHAERSGDDDRAELLAAADAEQAERRLSDATLWPYRAAFDQFVVQYLEWLDERDDQGWRFEGGEVERRITPAALGGATLHGKIDRIDRHDDGMPQLIDYKTGRPEPLKEQLRARLEDTQLAVYAALLDDDPAAARTQAMYLLLSDRRPPDALPHKDVAASARVLVEGLGADLAALRAGGTAPALGEGDACRFCDARGLCRRDHWKQGA